jgi:hypothetical protein
MDVPRSEPCHAGRRSAVRSSGYQGVLVSFDHPSVDEQVAEAIARLCSKRPTFSVPGDAVCLERAAEAPHCARIDPKPFSGEDLSRTEAIMTAEQPGKIGLWRELQVLWRILLRWRKYRVGDYMRAVQQELHRETFDSSRKERANIGSEK